MEDTTRLRRNAKEMKRTETLWLCGMKLEELDDLEAFENLKWLWIARNALTSLQGLQANARLHGLFASHNEIRTLAGIEWLTQLEELVLAGNKLQGLQCQLGVLRRLRRLRRLDLANNPLAEETRYRQHVIRALPWLRILDGLRVTDNEREESTPPAARGNGATWEPCSERVRRKVRDKRIVLGPDLIAHDPRRTGTVPASVFADVLDRYGIECPDVDGAVDYDAFCRALLEPSKRRASPVCSPSGVPSIARTCSDATPTLPTRRPISSTVDDDARPLTPWEAADFRRRLPTTVTLETARAAVDGMTTEFGLTCDVDPRIFGDDASASQDVADLVATLRWRPLSASIAQAKAASYFDEAAKLQRPLLAGDESARARVVDIAARATRFSVIARARRRDDINAAPSHPKHHHQGGDLLPCSLNLLL